IFAVLVPIMSFVIDWPAQVNQSPRRAPAVANVPPTSPAAIKSSREIFSDSRFWLLSIAIVIFTAAAVTLRSHGPSMAVARSVDHKLAATVLSGTGGGAIIGGLGFGWLIDKIGPFRALIVAMVLTVFLWIVFSMATTLSAMVVLAFFLGLNMGPT